jgi:hypothetical protein
VLPSIGLAQSGSTDESPAAFRDAFVAAQGQNSDRVAAALKTLGEEPEWEPYFRAPFNRLTDSGTRSRLRPALEKCRTKLIDWNLVRAQTWAKERRFDYLAALAAQVDDRSRSLVVGELIFSAQKEIRDEFRKTTAVGNTKSFAVLPTFADFAKESGFRDTSGDRVVVTKSRTPANLFVHSCEIDFEYFGISHSVLVCEKSLRPRLGAEELSCGYSVVVCNADCQIASASDTLLICDGDLHFPQVARGHCYASVIVCNGNISASPPGNFELNSALLYASGDFTGNGQAWQQRRATILAGGKNESELPKDHEQHMNFRSGVKDIPFGIKFVSQKDVGVDVRAGEGVV